MKIVLVVSHQKSLLIPRKMISEAFRTRVENRHMSWRGGDCNEEWKGGKVASVPSGLSIFASFIVFLSP